jgi:hypothetical protein
MADSFFSPHLEPSHYGVHLGVWTNWSRGPVFGATLTMSREQGSLLISFTAFFVTIVAARFWSAACLILHRSFSVAEPRDALHHQRQAIFRNSPSSTSGLWSLIQLSLVWRDLAQRRLIRTLPSIFFAGISLLLFAFASGFSSSISTAIGDEVLIDGTNCGYISLENVTYDTMSQVISPWQAGITSNAANYAQQVYSPDSTGVFDGTIFVQRKLDTIVNREAPCPFSNHLCRSYSSNLLLDTGYIDIRNNLGVNLQRNQSIQLRRVLHCAPLVTEGHKAQTLYKGFNYTSYNYGPTLSASYPWTTPNYTFIVKDFESQYLLSSSVHSLNNYALR